MEYFVESCVRGYHVYKDVWSATLGETLLCVAEVGNVHDPYAVAIVHPSPASHTVGHVPRSMSAACHFFIRRNGSIVCQVTGHRRHSGDLVQGGLEIPCTYTFIGSSKEVNKVRKLLSNSSLSSAEPPFKKKMSNQKALTQYGSSIKGRV